MKPRKGDNIVALVNSYGFQKRHWKRGDRGVLGSDEEAKGMPEKQFRCFNTDDVKADEAAKEKAEKERLEKLAAEDAVKQADADEKAQAKADAQAAKEKKQDEKDAAAKKK